MAKNLDALIQQMRDEAMLGANKPARNPAGAVNAFEGLSDQQEAQQEKPKTVMETETSVPVLSAASKKEIESRRALKAAEIERLRAAHEKEQIQAEEQIREMQKKIVPPKEQSNLLAEALIAGIPTILGAGIGAAVGKPGMFGAGLAAGAGAGEKALGTMKAAEKEERAAQIRAAEDRLKTNIELLKAKTKDSFTRAQLDQAQKEYSQYTEGLIKGLGPGVEKAMVKQETGAPGKTLASEQVTKIADIGAARSQLSGITETIGKIKSYMGPVAGRTLARSPFSTDPTLSDAQMKIAAQVIGTSLEGGKLTDADIERYREMLPKMSDTPDVAAGKVRLVESLLNQREQAYLKSAKQAGYNVESFGRKQAQAPVAIPVTATAVAPTMAKPDFSKMSEAELKKYLGK